MRQLGPYQLIAPLGDGAGGEVWRAFDTELRREVAIKALRGAVDEVSCERFEREARSLAAIRHPGVLKIHATRRDLAPTPLLIMELVPGVTLEAAALQALREDPEGWWTELPEIIAQLADALAACHAAGVVHRDLKPENILYDRERRRAVLVDFGLVKVRQPGLAELTRTEDVLGTPHFMAPEQLDGAEVGPAADVWALGATLLFAASGQTPYPEADPTQFLINRASNPPRPLATLNPRAPKAFARACGLALALDPASRASLDDIVAALEPAPPRRPILPALLGLLLLGFAAFLATWQLLPPPQTLLVNAPAPLVNGSPLTLTGTALPPGTKVTAGAASATSDDRGAFALSLDLADGRHELELRAGELKETIALTVDTTPPRLEWVSQERAGARLAEGGSIAARILDASDVDVIRDGARERCAELWTCAVPESQELELILEDAAGNRSAQTIRAISALELELQRRLGDRRRWNEAPPWLQDALIATVAERLEPHYEPLPAEHYECGGAATRVGRFRHVASGILMHLVPGGRLTLGRPKQAFTGKKGWLDGESKRDRSVFEVEGLDYASAPTPPRELLIPPMLVAAQELNWREWLAIGGEIPARFKIPERRTNEPARALTGAEIVDRLQAQSGGLRLPSEAEWEYAARAGTTTRFPWGEAFDARYAWPRPPPGERFPPKTYATDAHADAPNAFGLLDVIGHVAELCADELIFDYKDGPTDARPRGDPAGPRRAIRGAGLATPEALWGCAERYGFDMTNRVRDVGLRPVASLPGWR